MTFQELQQRLSSVKNRKVILQHIIEHIDANFRPIAGESPKKILLTEEKTGVPAQAFEDVVSELLQEVAQAEEEIKNILGAPLAPSSTKKN